MPASAPIPRSITTADEILPPETGLGVAAAAPRTAAGQAALAAAQALARQATAAATLRAYKADWTHFSQWCAAHGFVAGAGRAGDRRRLPRQPGRQPRPHHHPPPAVGTGQNAPLQRPAVEPGASRHPGPAAGRAAHPRPPGAKGRRADACRCCASCWRPATRAPAAGATARCCCSASPARCAAPNWWRCASRTSPSSPAGCGCASVRGKTDQAGQGAEIGLPRGRHAETCPVRAFEAWQAVARRKAGPLFRKISTGGRDRRHRAASRCGAPHSRPSRRHGRDCGRRV